MSPTNPWRTTPRRTTVIFLCAVFCIFASFGFTTDVIDMGTQAPLRFGMGVLLSGLFAVGYAAGGITLRGKFWKAFLPLFALQSLSISLLIRWLPDVPRPTQLDTVKTDVLQGRLVFDGLAIVVSICLGYAGLVIVSISEGRRHGRSLAEKATLEGEMAAAREVQRITVPEDLPQVEGYAIESAYRPAAEVGGDFFQVLPLPSGRTLLVIGDVSGKGLRAAMIVSMIVGMLSTVTGSSEEPAEILGELNRRLCGRIHDGFATCLAVRLEEKGRYAVANAGHLSPYRNGVEVQLPGSLPLGLSKDTPYEQAQLQMAVGDRLVLLTDGIVEARNEQGELLGFARVEAMLAAGNTAQQVVETAQQHGQNDDITALRVLRRE